MPVKADLVPSLLLPPLAAVWSLSAPRQFVFGDGSPVGWRISGVGTGMIVLSTKLVDAEKTSFRGWCSCAPSNAKLDVVHKEAGFKISDRESLSVDAISTSPPPWLTRADFCAGTATAPSPLSSCVCSKSVPTRFFPRRGVFGDFGLGLLLADVARFVDMGTGEEEFCPGEVGILLGLRMGLR